MGSDNVEIFRKVIFNIPETRKLFALIVLTGITGSTIFGLSTHLFTSFALGVSSLALISVFGFILPTLLAGELLHAFLPEYPRRWGYFLSFVNEMILFAFSLILTGANNSVNAWHILWLGLATVYMSNLFVLLLTVGYSYLTRVAVLSSVQPVSIIALFHIFIGAAAGITLLEYASFLGVLVVAGILLAGAFLVAEYLIRVNAEKVSVLELTEGLLQKKQEALDLGYWARPEVQTLQIENSSGSAVLAAPWIHPGPIEGFGGGQITSKIIENLNSDGQGFFLHVPSTHESDPADPQDYRKILEAIKSPDKQGEVSEMIEKDYGRVRFYGRRIGDQMLVFMDAEQDDYEVSIFKEMLDLDQVLLVDMHCHDREDYSRGEVWYGTEEAEELRENLRDFLSELEGLETHDYSAGFNSKLGEDSYFTLVEEVQGQKTLTFGIEGNGTSGDLRQLRDKLKERYDKVIVFSTDTHQSIHEMSSRKQIKPEKIEESIRKSEKQLSPAIIGLGNDTAERMKLLKEDYSGLVFSVNILTRLIILSLVVVYLWLVAWVFF